MTRAERIERLAGGSFDVVVIGAGVIGASTAWAAARAGASVAVVDRGDVAGATSSASSKLLHGGLRYLRNGQVGLVREAHRERWWNARVVAPHLVHPLPFLLAIGPESPYPRWQLRAGVIAYSALSRFRDGRSGAIAARDAARLVPGLRIAGRSFVRYFDHQTDDARLVIAVLRSAEALGARWANHLEVIELRAVDGQVRGVEMRDLIGGETFAIDARVVVNATGPWVDAIRRLEDPAARPSVRLSKGAHLLLATDGAAAAAVTTPLPGGRVSFALPWHDMLLLGTTDESFDGDPASLHTTDRDEAQILDEASQSLDETAVRADLVRARFAGLRALPVGSADTAAAHRETMVTTGRGGMVSVAGGKLTTWRRIGIHVAGTALGAIGAPQPDPRPGPILGAGDPETIARGVQAAHPALDRGACAHLARTYGTLAFDVLGTARDEPDLYEPIVPGAPDILAQVRYGVAAEGACTVEDILRRRTTVAIRGLSELAASRVERYLEVPQAA